MYSSAFASELALRHKVSPSVCDSSQLVRIYADLGKCCIGPAHFILAESHQSRNIPADAENIVFEVNKNKPKTKKGVRLGTTQQGWSVLCDACGGSRSCCENLYDNIASMWPLAIIKGMLLQLKSA